MNARHLIALAVIAVRAGTVEAQAKIDIHRASSSTVSVRLSGAFSSLRITAWEHDSVALTGAVGAGSRLDGGPLNTAGPVTGLKFYLEASDQSGIAANKLELQVPRQARVWVKSGSADIDAHGVTGGLDLNIVGGSVRVNAKPRELLIESMDGSVVVTGNPEFAKIKTATGDIAFDARADDVTLTTVSGTVAVNRGPVTRGRFESVTGAIVFAADIARAGDVRVDTHSGSIELRLTPSAAVEIDASTVTGTIENRWNHQRPIAGREGRGMELGTSSGTGGARVQVRSFKGNLRVTTR